MSPDNNRSTTRVEDLGGRGFVPARHREALDGTVSIARGRDIGAVGEKAVRGSGDWYAIMGHPRSAAESLGVGIVVRRSTGSRRGEKAMRRDERARILAIIFQNPVRTEHDPAGRPADSDILIRHGQCDSQNKSKARGRNAGESAHPDTQRRAAPTVRIIGAYVSAGDDRNGAGMRAGE